MPERERLRHCPGARVRFHPGHATVGRVVGHKLLARHACRHCLAGRRPRQSAYHACRRYVAGSRTRGAGCHAPGRCVANRRQPGYHRTSVLWTTRHGAVEDRLAGGGRRPCRRWMTHLRAWTRPARAWMSCGRAWTCPKTTCCDAMINRTTTSCGLGLDRHPRAPYCEGVALSPGGPRNTRGARRRTRRDGPRGNRRPDDPTDGPAATRHPIP